MCKCIIIVNNFTSKTKHHWFNFVFFFLWIGIEQCFSFIAEVYFNFIFCSLWVFVLRTPFQQFKRKWTKILHNSYIYFFESLSRELAYSLHGYLTQCINQKSYLLIQTNFLMLNFIKLCFLINKSVKLFLNYFLMRFQNEKIKEF